MSESGQAETIDYVRGDGSFSRFRTSAPTKPSVSAIQQKNANYGMALKSVQYLYRCALERGLANLQRKTAGVLFLNSTRRD
jgi:hypothetical protein